jgi:hypothetical protein
MVLRRELREMLSPGCSIGPLALTRAKYKPGRHLLAYYTFNVHDSAAGLTRPVPVEVEWRNPAGFAAPDERVAEMQEEARRSGLLAPFTQLQRDNPEWGIRLRVWPLDPQFPQLVRLGDPAHAPRLFREAGLLETSEAGCVEITPIRYRPGERHVLKYRIEPQDGAVGQPERYYAKLYPDGPSANRAQRIATRVVDWLEKSVPGFHGVRPAGWSEADAVILYPHAEGVPLSQQLRPQPLRHSPDWLAGQLRLVGAALAALHHGPRSLAEDLAPNPFEKEVKVIARASQQVQALLPETGARVLRLLERAQELHARLPQEAPTFTHSDFKADHLLVSRSGITLIDFDTCALADPALDLGKFLADLEWWHELSGAGDPRPAQQAFLAGYTGGDAPGRMERARLYHALILTKITLRRAKVYSKDWAELTEKMIGRAEGVLAAES